jgi:hypothetical protein
MDSSNAGWLITYFSLAQLPRSSSRHRSLQNGKSALVSESVGLLQMGHPRVIQGAYRKGHARAPTCALRTQSGPPFKITQRGLLVLFVVRTIAATIKFRIAPLVHAA